jgi:pyruvate dehydrogenase E1 component
VSISTGLGGWINRVGVYSSDSPLATEDSNPGALLRWEPKPSGQHIEFGISEMNLFMWLSQAGLLKARTGFSTVPIGTIYDPFICRGLDALIYALYVGARFIVVGTPSGVTLSPEGGAHQSTVTQSLGMELPGLVSYEPAFAREAVWCLVAGITQVLAADGHSSYLRLSTRTVDQRLADPIEERLGRAEWRRQVLAGGYRLLGPEDAVEPLPRDAPSVVIVTAGATVSEAVKATRGLHYEEVGATLIVASSPGQLAQDLHRTRLEAVRSGRPPARTHLDDLIPPSLRHVPMVTVADASSHGLAFLGGAFGSPVVPLGVDAFGQSGTIADLYGYAGIDADHIVEAALLAIDMA